MKWNSGPIVTLSCTQNPSWKTFWGPEILCIPDGDNKSLTSIVSDVLNITTTSTTDTFLPNKTLTDNFKCSIYSTNVSLYEVIYQCSLVSSNWLDNLSHCVYNTSVAVSKVLYPVSEVDLSLPNFKEVFKLKKNIECGKVFQILNCHNLPINNSFYENVFDEENFSFLKPIQCFLNFKILNSDDSTTVVVASDDSENIYNLRDISYDWSFLFVIIFIIAGGLGNILVCLAVARDRKLQNVTNYFLFSLAIADLLVSLFVMPLGAIPSFLGKYMYRFIKAHVLLL